MSTQASPAGIILANTEAREAFARFMHTPGVNDARRIFINMHKYNMDDEFF